jgi:hypothetical protein
MGMSADLRAAIANTLHSVSARLLPDLCERYGLSPGTYQEAYDSKRTYVMKRLMPLPRGKVLEIARSASEDYPTEELLRAIERSSGSQPADISISETLASFNEGGVYAVWRRALERRERDPEGAITLARTLLESVCKHIIDASNGASTYSDTDDLPKLYRAAASLLRLAPDQYVEETFKRILGGCQSVVEGLGTMRNKLSDAHGRGGRMPVRPGARHATLAVNLAGTVAMFLVETWNERQRAGL